MVVTTIMCASTFAGAPGCYCGTRGSPHLRSHLQHMLAGIADLERILGRLSLGTVTPRELVALRHSIAKLPEIEAGLSTCQSRLLLTLGRAVGPSADIEALDC